MCVCVFYFCFSLIPSFNVGFAATTLLKCLLAFIIHFVIKQKKSTVLDKTSQIWLKGFNVHVFWKQFFQFEMSVKKVCCSWKAEKTE